VGTRGSGTQRTEQSTVGVNPGYPWLGSGAIGVAPSAAVAVDNPSRLSPAVGSELIVQTVSGQLRNRMLHSTRPRVSVSEVGCTGFRRIIGLVQTTSDTEALEVVCTNRRLVRSRVH
jgi:hypothetical protein